MAEGLVKNLAGEKISPFSAGVSASQVHENAVKVMSEIGIDIREQSSKKIDDLDKTGFDLIITLCDEANDFCSSPTLQNKNLFVGIPEIIHWHVDDPLKSSNNIEIFREARDKIKAYIETFIKHGYLDVLYNKKIFQEHFFDALNDGIIAHDINRSIFIFNHIAEKITGFSREEVIGKDCHNVFPDGLCGKQCSFCENGDDKDHKINNKFDYEIKFVTKNGENKNLKMAVVPVNMGPGKGDGIVASIQDITEISELRIDVKNKYSFHGMAGNSRQIEEVFKTVRQFSSSDYPILITGESGTGKELTAKAIHNESRRKGGPFVPVNCGALPEHILESELFGHVRGAFTGAIRDKKGRFELADGGTIFLDEIGEISPSFQVKLLRVIEQKSFERVGDERTIKVNVRVISATNRELQGMIENGGFREDLFYRLSVIPVKLPPLRERINDIPLLVQQIIEKIKKETGFRSKISDEVMERFINYDWPGNIRQLINVLQFSSVRAQGKEVKLQHLPPEIKLNFHNAIKTSIKDVVSIQNGLVKGKKRLSKKTVKGALVEAGGNKAKAAKILGVGRATLYRFLWENES